MKKKTSDNDLKQIKLKIFQQGAVIANHAVIYKQTEDMVLILVDLATKDAEYMGTFGLGDSPGHSGYMLAATTLSGKIKKGYTLDDWTYISLPEFDVVYETFAVQLSRYTLKIALFRKDPGE